MPCKLHFPGCFATWLLPVKSLPIGVTSDDQMVGQGVALSPIIAFSFLVILGSVSTVVMSPPPQSQGWTVAVLSPPQSSVQFSCSVVPGSLRPHGLQHARPPRPSPTPGVYSNLCPLSWWCHPTISSSVIPFSSCLQSFPVSGSFPMSQLLALGSQSIGASASASVLPTNIQDWFPLGWTGWISLQSKELSRVFSNTTVQKHQFFGAQLCLQSNSHISHLSLQVMVIPEMRCLPWALKFWGHHLIPFVPLTPTWFPFTPWVNIIFPQVFFQQLYNPFLVLNLL